MVTDTQGSGRAYGLSATNVAASATPSVTLAWSSASLDANVFKIYFTTDLTTISAVYLGGQGLGLLACTSAHTCTATSLPRRRRLRARVPARGRLHLGHDLHRNWPARGHRLHLHRPCRQQQHHDL